MGDNDNNAEEAVSFNIDNGDNNHNNGDQQNDRIPREGNYGDLLSILVSLVERINISHDYQDRLAAQVVSLSSQARQRPITKVEMPEFLDNDPRGWLDAVEASFNAVHMTEEKDKYFQIVAQLPQHVRDNLKNKINLNEFSDGKLDQFKSIIIHDYEPSDTVRREQILNRKRLDKDKPSVAWSWYLNTGKDIFSIQQLLDSWLKILPRDIGLTIHHSVPPISHMLQNDPNDQNAMKSITGLAFVADSMIERYGRSSNSSTQSEVSSINRIRNRNAQSSRSFRSNRSSRNNNNCRRADYNPKGPWCRNHFLYRDNARSCTRPQDCSYTNNNSNRRSRSRSQSFSRPNSSNRSRQSSPNRSRSRQSSPNRNYGQGSRSSSPTSSDRNRNRSRSNSQSSDQQTN